MSSNDQSDSAVAPPVIIVVAIGAAVIIVVVVAALYRICRRPTVEADEEDIQSQRWSPNKRTQEQIQYMESVRWRNNANAWDRAQIAKREEESNAGGDFRRGLLRRQYEERRARELVGCSTGQEVTAEEFLAIENPYRGMLDEPSLRASPQRQQFRPRINLNEDNTIQQRLTNDGFEEIALTTPGTEQVLSRNGIKITVNDESDDIVDAQWMDDSSKWPPRQSRMFRTSSVYSGDALLPSTHLHLVQSSSSYALPLRDNTTSKVKQNVEGWELRNREQ